MQGILCMSIQWPQNKPSVCKERQSYSAGYDCHPFVHCNMFEIILTPADDSKQKTSNAQCGAPHRVKASSWIYFTTNTRENPCFPPENPYTCSSATGWYKRSIRPQAKSSQTKPVLRQLHQKLYRLCWELFLSRRIEFDDWTVNCDRFFSSFISRVFDQICY